jgi:hypothetical protein
VAADASAPRGNALSLTTSASGVVSWAKDEYYEAYQVVSLEGGQNPLTTLSYHLNQPPAAGGGYLRLEFLRDAEFLSLMMFYWGNHDERSSYYPRAIGYALTGINQSWLYLEQLAKKSQGYFWRLPMDAGKWHTLSVNAGGLYGQAKQSPGAFAQLQPNKMSLAVGTWNDKEPGTTSEARFAKISVTPAAADTASTLDGAPLTYTPAASVIDFGTEQQGGGKRDASA